VVAELWGEKKARQLADELARRYPDNVQSQLVGIAQALRDTTKK
jgi:hypothetical protein